MLRGVSRRRTEADARPGTGELAVHLLRRDLGLGLQTAPQGFRALGSGSGTSGEPGSGCSGGDGLDTAGVGGDGGGVVGESGGVAGPGSGRSGPGGWGTSATIATA